VGSGGGVRSNDRLGANDANGCSCTHSERSEDLGRVTMGPGGRTRIQGTSPLSVADLTIGEYGQCCGMGWFRGIKTNPNYFIEGVSPNFGDHRRYRQRGLGWSRDIRVFEGLKQPVAVVSECIDRLGIRPLDFGCF